MRYSVAILSTPLTTAMTSPLPMDMPMPDLRRHKVPATIITGFLGSGKTTLIRHLLQNAGGRRIALVINEFGDVGVDGDLLRGCGTEACAEDDIVELANGCLCCTVADDFQPTLSALLDRAEPPDHIIIETSGLALPKPLVKAFAWPDIRTRATVDGLVAVVDGRAVAEGRFAEDPDAVAAQRAADEQLDHDSPLAELLEEQVSCADLILINKTDLMGEDDRSAALAAIAPHRRDGTGTMFTANGAVAPEVLIGLGAGAEDDLASRPSHHDAEDLAHDHDDFDSFIVEVPHVASLPALADALLPVIAAHDILRVKGFVAIDGKPMRGVIQAVGTRIQHYFDAPWPTDATRATRLVVIGQHGLDEGAVRRDLATALSAPALA